MFITSCFRPNQGCIQQSCLTEKKVAIACGVGILTIALGIILAAVYWPKGNFQILMTHEGKAVLGLVLGGFMLSSIFGAILCCRSKRQADPQVIPKETLTLKDIKTGRTTEKVLFSGKKVVHLSATKGYIVAQVEKGTLAETKEIEFYKFDRTASCPSAQLISNLDVKGSITACTIAFDQYFVLGIQESESRYSLVICNLSDKSSPIALDFPSKITALHFESNFFFDKVKREKILFVGDSKGSISFIDFERHLILKTMTMLDKVKPLEKENEKDTKEIQTEIVSILSSTNAFFKGQVTESLLVCGTNQSIIFFDPCQDLRATIGGKSEVVGIPVAMTSATLVSVHGFIIYTYNIHDQSKSLSPLEPSDNVLSMSCLTCSSTLAITGTENGQLLFWDLKTKTPDASVSVYLNGKPNIQSILLVQNVVYVTTADNRVIQLEF